MEDKAIAIAFPDEFLPENVKEILVLENLSPTSSSFITPDPEEYLADVVFKITLKNEAPDMESCCDSILLDHKSSIDHYIDFQILQYLAHSYRQQIQNRQKFQLVIPFLYHHGETKWQIRTLSDFFPGIPEHLYNYFPSFSKVFIDLNHLNNQQIGELRNTFVRAAISIQKLSRHGDQIIDSVLRILHTLEPETDRNFARILLDYLLQITGINKQSLQVKIKNVAPQIKSEILSTYDQIKIEGKMEGKSEVVLNLHEAGMDIEFIVKVTELSQSAVEEIIKNKGKNEQ